MKPIDGRKLPKVITDARSSNHPAAYALQGGDVRKRLSPDVRETILLKIACGMTARQAAHDTGISPGTVHQRSLDDPEFAEKVRQAREIGAETLADTILDVALDPDMPAAQKTILIDALKWLAKMHNRGRYGDKLAIDATHTISPVMLPTIALPSIPDAEFIEVDRDDDRDD